MKRYRRNELQAREGIDTLFYTFQNYHEPSVEMSYKPERALTRQHCVKRQVIHIWGRNELQAREGIDTILAESHEGKHALCRNELQAREGIDTKYQSRASIQIP